MAGDRPKDRPGRLHFTALDKTVSDENRPTIVTPAISPEEEAAKLFKEIRERDGIVHTPPPIRAEEDSAPRVTFDKRWGEEWEVLTDGGDTISMDGVVTERSGTNGPKAITGPYDTAAAPIGAAAIRHSLQGSLGARTRMRERAETTNLPSKNERIIHKVIQAINSVFKRIDNGEDIETIIAAMAKPNTPAVCAVYWIIKEQYEAAKKAYLEDEDVEYDIIPEIKVEMGIVEGKDMSKKEATELDELVLKRGKGEIMKNTKVEIENLKKGGRKAPIRSIIPNIILAEAVGKEIAPRVAIKLTQESVEQESDKGEINILGIDEDSLGLDSAETKQVFRGIYAAVAAIEVQGIQYELRQRKSNGKSRFRGGEEKYLETKALQERLKQMNDIKGNTSEEERILGMRIIKHGVHATHERLVKDKGLEKVRLLYGGEKVLEDAIGILGEAFDNGARFTRDIALLRETTAEKTWEKGKKVIEKIPISSALYYTYPIYQILTEMASEIENGTKEGASEGVIEKIIYGGNKAFTPEASRVLTEKDVKEIWVAREVEQLRQVLEARLTEMESELKSHNEKRRREVVRHVIRIAKENNSKEESIEPPIDHDASTPEAEHSDIYSYLQAITRSHNGKRLEKGLIDQDILDDHRTQVGCIIKLFITQLLKLADKNDIAH